MIQALKLIFPALIPSWRFFDVIAPSPRIEFRLVDDSQNPTGDWQEFRPRPLCLSPAEMFTRLFYNAQWNELLFLMSCAERLMQNPTQHSEDEIFNRIRRSVNSSKTKSYLQFRVLFIYRDGAGLKNIEAFLSPARPIAGGSET